MTESGKKNRNIAAGFLSLSTSKVIFMISGFAIYFSLPRILSPEDFGNYGVVIGFLSVFNMMLVVGAIQAVSKYVSERPFQEHLIRKTAFRIQTFLGGIVSLLLFAGADRFAWMFRDPTLAPLIRMGAPVPVLYSFYAVAIGSLNGRGLFHRQALLDIAFAIFKTVFIISGGWLTGRVFGAIAGFAVTALVITAVGLYHINTMKRDPRSSDKDGCFSWKVLAKFELSVMILTLLSNLLINIDLFLVKSMTPHEISSKLAGYYTAVQTFARIPYVLVVALALVMFPLISGSTFAKDLDKSRKYLRAAFRFPLVMIAPISIFLSTHALECLNVVYPRPYSAAAPTLAVLALAELLLAMFYLATTLINGSGNPVFSIAATVIAIGCHGVVCCFLIPRMGLLGAALGSLVGWSIGFLICAGYLSGLEVQDSGETFDSMSIGACHDNYLVCCLIAAFHRAPGNRPGIHFYSTGVLEPVAGFL